MNRLDPEPSRAPIDPDPGPARREQTTAAPGAAVPSRPRRAGTAVGRSFVIEVAAGSAAEDFHGRVQHLATHDGGNFSSVEMLVSIIRRVLGRPDPDEADDG
jgi:hypothetical protein